MDSSSDKFGVNAVFHDYSEHLAKETEIKDELRLRMKEVDNALREVYVVLQKVHRPGSTKSLDTIMTQAEEKFGLVRQLYKVLDEKVPEGSYFKYSFIWNNNNSWGTFLAAFTMYLKDEKLATQQEISDKLGLSNLTTLQLDIEEYLIGLCQMSNELSRFSMNCVTSEDYGRSVRIAEFLNSLNTGFRMLNLKNDNLRKKFDSIKYDLKKVEEVVYDLSIRGLIKHQADQSDGKEVKGDAEK